MGKSFRMASAVAIFGVLFFCVTARAWSQSGSGSGNGSGNGGGNTGAGSVPGSQLPGPSGPRVSTPRTSLDGPDTGETTKMEEQQAQARNSDRQRRLQMDTEKLLALATELKQQVDKTDKNTLSLEVIKKADEIEKLAKSVKDRMKG